MVISTSFGSRVSLSSLILSIPGSIKSSFSSIFMDRLPFRLMTGGVISLVSFVVWTAFTTILAAKVFPWASFPASSSIHSFRA